jgi:hypothetical protein
MKRLRAAPGTAVGGDPRILRRPFREQLAIHAGQALHERVAILLQLLGRTQRVTLPEGNVEAVLAKCYPKLLPSC